MYAFTKNVCVSLMYAITMNVCVSLMYAITMNVCMSLMYAITMSLRHPVSHVCTEKSPIFSGSFVENDLQPCISFMYG